MALAKGKWLLGTTIMIASAGLYVLWAFDPGVASFYPRCVFHSLTGLQCPGCGATRAIHHLLHGDVAGAFRLNAMLFLFGPLLIAGAAIEGRSLATGSSAPRLVHKPWVAWTAAIVLVGWAVVRNVLYL